MKNNEKEKRKPLTELTLLDRFLFDTAMNEPEFWHNVLSIIFDDDELPPVHIGMTELKIEPYYDSRAVRIDLLAFDENNVVYDAESQQKNEGNEHLRRRSRLYQSYIDVNLLEPGERDFRKLNDVYVIFIAPFDLFGQEKYMYTFRMTCDEVPGLELKDGGVRIFLNTHGKNDDEVSSELSEFLHFVEHPSKDNGNFQNPRVQKLADQIENIKSNQEVGVKYMRLWEELDDAKKEGEIMGREESQIESIRNLMDSLSLSMEQAMDALKIPKDKREEYKKQLEMNA